jgi:glycosyltransferase involved in cell wall biosynthesis
MRILQVAIQAQGGGAEKVALTLHQQFSKNHQSRIVYMYPDLPLEGSNQENLNIPRLKVIGIPLGIFRLLRISRNFKPDITLIHCEPAMLLTCLTPSLGELFVVEHQPFHWKGIKGLVIHFSLKILRLRGCHTVNLRESRVLASKSFYIPNPVEMVSASPISGRQELPLSMIWIGRLSFDKGFDRLPKVTSKAKVEVIHIFGSGDMKDEVGFENTKCIYHGFDPQVWVNLPTNPLLLVTSRWEGDGLVILEALVRCIPILVIDFADMQELPIPKSSICRDEVEMAKKISNIQSGALDVASLVNLEARLMIEKLRSPKEIAQKYLDTFAKVLE